MEQPEQHFFVSLRRVVGFENGIVDDNDRVVNFGDDVAQIKTRISTVDNGLVIKKSRIKNAGHGLFTTRTYLKDEVITFYDGAVSETINVADIDPAYKTHARRINGFYTMYGNYTENGELINLEREDHLLQMRGKGGGAFLNSMKEAAKNNCGWHVIRSRRNVLLTGKEEDPFQIVILIYALAPIKKGVELFIDYGKTYWATEDTSTLHRGIVKPSFITKEMYYTRLREASEASSRRVIKRQAPIHIDNNDTNKKPKYDGRCVQCSSLTTLVDIELNVFCCKEECLRAYRLVK